jgi:poly(A)-specific ribonuclease
MEVDNISFYPLLLDILHDLSEAHFVAFDLELSGVPSKGIRSGSGQGRPTLQQRYLETKEAAERYQILQIGLTFVQQDVEGKKYVLKPYNFELSPVINEKGLDIERIFSFQSGAVEFLLKVGFDMALPFEHGIPYLSRLETHEARTKHAQRQDKSAIADIQLKPSEVESLAFLEHVRGEIKSWLASRNIDALEYLNIGPVPTDETTVKDNSEPPQELGRFEKRLIHQLVRAEFPELVTISKRGFVQIVRFNKEREDKIAADRTRELNERIGRQKGFRWVIEALRGGDISNLDLRECAKDPQTGESIFFDMDDFKATFHRASNILRHNPRILVGHNCFLDLVYIYRTFIGELPDTVEEFQKKINHLWPMIIDTKYMSTHNCGDINPVSSLEQIATQLSAEPKPVMEVDKEHKKYQGVDSLHEAGYDSFLTAQIAVRLSAELEKEGSYVNTTAVTAVGAIGEDTKADELSNGVNGLNLTETTLNAHTYDADNGTSPPSEPDGFMPSVEGAKWKRRGDATLPIPDPSDPFEYKPRELKHRQRDDRKAEGFDGGMPRFVSDFWRTYGNKLRVFGTDEGVCILDEHSKDLEDEEDEVSIGQGGVAVPEA